MIGVTGINHLSASLDIRERFIISKDEINSVSSLILAQTSISEMVILSTCNRTEIFYYQKDNNFIETSNTLKLILHKYKNIEEDFSGNFYSYQNKEAIKHLFKVTSGIDSLVFGEDQIVNQVKEAYLQCTELTLTDAVLMRLFQKSFETSKKVRTETGIQNGTRSISYIAVEKCLNYFGSLSDKSVLLIGAGETGKLTLLNLVKKGIRSLYITNRTDKKATDLANDFNGTSVPFNKFKDYLERSDIVITVTNSSDFLITISDVESAIAKRKGTPQVYIDLSVPRNINPNVFNIQNVILHAVDDLQEIAEFNKIKRLDNKEKANNIITKMTDEYYSWLKNRNLRPVINKITNSVQNLHKNELKNYENCLSEDTFQAIEQYAGRLTQKYIRSFIKNLKTINANGNTDIVLEAIQELFIFDSDDKQ